MAPEWFDLRLAVPFAVLADELHFGRAAERLGAKQPALSQQIARLERQLGVALIGRDGRRITLTPAGTRFLMEVRELLDRVRLAETAIRGGDGELRLHLGATTNPVVNAAVGAFLSAHPQILVSTTQGTPTAAPRAVQAGEADVGFSVREDTPPGLCYAPVTSGPFGVATPVEHPIARRGRASWTDLEGAQIIVAPPGVSDGSNLLLRRTLRRMGVRVREVLSPQVPRATYMLHQIATGPALLVTPPWPIHPLPPGVAWIMLDPEQHLELGVVWDDRHATEAVRRFVAWVRARSMHARNE